MDRTQATPHSQPADPARERIARLFKFVAALYAQRNPAVRQISDQEWVLRLSDIPEHESISLTRPVDVVTDGANTEEPTEPDARPLLRCGRPRRTEPPEAPEVLEGWLGWVWTDPTATPVPVPSRTIAGTQTEVVLFADDEQRVAALEAYRSSWDLWSARERATIAAGEVFERLYELHGTLQRDGERFGLAVADGMLVWGRPGGGVRHPLLLRPVRLEFEPQIPEFRIVEGDAATEFYSALFRSMEDVEGHAVGRLRAEADVLDPHPLGGAETDGFLRSVAATLSSRGAYVGSGTLPPERDDPVIGRAPVFVLRRRTSGVARAIDAIVEHAMLAPEFSQALRNIVGVPDEDSARSGESSLVTVIQPRVLVDANADDTVLFTKPANAEQLDIARCLDRDDCVLVQGPPGTGKTHTIANLLGHLLAEGKSVLVVSHTTKALKVLREKVVPRLQPLCVSVLDSSDDDAALKSSIEGIVERIGSADIGRLERDSASFTAERTALVAEVRGLQSAVVSARMDEQRSVVVGGEGTSPIDAAKEVAAGAGRHDWIPSPVALGEPLALTAGEVVELYRTNALISADDEAQLTQPLPDLAAFPSAHEFVALKAEHDDLEAFDRSHRAHLWEPANSNDVDELDLALQAARDAVEALQQLPAWTGHLVEAGTDAAERASWDGLLAEIEAVRTEALASGELLLRHAPRLASEIATDRAAEIYEAIDQDVARTSKVPSFLTLLMRRDWKTAIDGARVDDNVKPRLPTHFAALACAARIASRRERLRRRWTMQVGPLDGPGGDELGDAVEVSCRKYAALITASLEWSDQRWAHAVDRLTSVGFRWSVANAEADARFPEDDTAGRITRMLSESFPAAFAAERARRRWTVVQNRLATLRSTASTWAHSRPADALRGALASLNTAAYREAYSEIDRLRALAVAVMRRGQLLGSLERVAAGWAGAVRSRVGAHGAAMPPGDPLAAWRWRQFEDELNRRALLSMPDLLLKLEQRRESLHELTAELVDRRAWRAQAARTTLEQRQALVGFAGAKRRLGRGTGKRAGTFARMARELMTQARSAVPVWIMPIVKAAEVFDPRASRFDVVIVDEASQSDVTGLLAFYLGRQVVVVGDDEQVSPSAVGERALDAQHLIDEFLQGIPNAGLYDGKQSLYDIAKASFGGTICLLEHFRCVPDIIRFSNALSYDGRIRPLREPRPEDPTPAVIAHRVASSGVVAKVNEDEARTVAALVVAAIEQPEYEGKTVGIVSLVGDEQAYRVESILRGLLPPTEIEARRLLAGSAAQFQGDERNVMFLSVVDAGTGVPLPLRVERTFQQRFNVAASRAQDQMWVVYSVDPGLELKPDDLRRRLIEHALDPGALGRSEAAALARAESPFEAEVIHRLSSAGFSITTQHSVGAYRIDIVVYGREGRRLAVECDGDRFHRTEELERDAERQAVLERLGWSFVRVRGSRFYRDRDAAMAPVFDRLRAMNIQPMGDDAETEDGAPDQLLVRIRTRASAIFADIAEREASGAAFGRRPARR